MEQGRQPSATGPPGPPQSASDPAPQAVGTRGPERPVPLWLSRLAKPRLALSLLAALGAALFVVNLGGYPFYTKGEPREAVTVLDIVEGGGVVLPMRAGVELPSKPPMMHWMAALLSLAAGRVNEWTVRMPSALMAIGGMLVCYLYVRQLFDEPSALLAALMLATTLQYLQAGSGARVDMTLTFFMAAASFEFIAIAEGLSRRWLLLYLSLAAAVLSKGPVGLVLPAAVALIWMVVEGRRGVIGRLHLGAGAIVVAVLAGGWYAAAAWVGGMAFLHKQIIAENIFTFLYNRRLSGGHAHPFYYLELALAVGFLPWTPLIAGPLASFFRRPGFANPRTRYLALWVLLVLLFYSFAHSKRGVYLLALYPPLAALIAISLSGAIGKSDRPPRSAPWFAWAAASVMLLAGAGALLAIALLWISPPASARILALAGIKAARFVPALSAQTAGQPLLALTLPALTGAIGIIVLRRRRAPLEGVIVAIVAASCAAVVAANLFVVPAIAHTVSLDDFARDAMRMVGAERVGYLGALNYDVAYYSRAAIPIVTTMGDEAPPYLLVWAEGYQHLPAAVRDRWPVVLESPPTELDGSGAMALVKRRLKSGAK